MGNLHEHFKTYWDGGVWHVNYRAARQYLVPDEVLKP